MASPGAQSAAVPLIQGAATPTSQRIVRIRHFLLAAIAPLLLGLLQACSSPQIYGAGQAWQKQACNKLNDADERRRCMESSNTSYEQYKDQSEAARSSK